MTSKLSYACEVQFACVSTLHTHQVSEATNRKTTRSCDKLQQSHPLLVVHLLHKLSTNHTFDIRFLTLRGNFDNFML